MFVNYGPYHLARAAALAAREPNAWFIELAASQDLYPWTARKDVLDGRLITLEDQPYELCNIGALCRNLIDCLDRIAPAAVVIAGYSERPMRAAAQWARPHGASVVMMSETTASDAPRWRWRELLKRRWISRYVDTAMVGGQPHREYLRGLGMSDDRIWDRYDVVDNSYFACAAAASCLDKARLRAHLGLPENYFLYVGRFAREKNLPLLLNAYRLYHDAHPGGWQLIMVGDGPQRRELEDLACELGIRICWPGFTQIDSLPPYYTLGAGFILPSVKEPWGLVVNEAMASGLPVLVSARCGCAADLVEDGRNGFIFDCDDSRVLAALMERISSMRTEDLAAMGLQSRRIIANWTPEVWAEHLSQAVRAARSCKRSATGAADFRVVSSNP